MTPCVLALVPAHNEAAFITRTVMSLQAQTVEPAVVVVVADNCTDRTAALARAAGAKVLVTQGNVHKKAGAMNFALGHLLPMLGDDAFVLITDADSILSEDWIEQALHALASPDVGAVCANFFGEPHERGLLHLLQRNEYARFARLVARKRARAQVLSGVATIFPVRVLDEVLAARQSGALPAAPGVYAVTASTEDIEMTHAVLKLGYRPLAPAPCVAWTDTMASLKAVKHQRVRWQRGMIDSLRMYGIDRVTLPYLGRISAIYLFSLLTPLYLLLLIATVTGGGSVSYDPRWLLTLPIFVAERVWTVRHQGWRSMLTAAALVPEWLYELYRSWVYWIALFRSARGADLAWVPT